jgi:hypothetical protein
LGVRSTVFGTSSPRTRLSGGCSGNFRIVLIVSLAGSALHLWRATVFAVFFPCFSSISFVFFFSGYRQLGFWVSLMGFGFVGFFFGRVVRGFWWVLGGSLGWGAFGACLGV